MTNSNTPRLPSLVLSLPFDSFFLFFSVSFRVVFSGSDSPEGQKRHGGRRDGTTNRRKVGEMSHSSIEARNKEKERERKGKREEKGILPRIYEHKGGEGGQKALRLVAGCGLLNSGPANSTISPPLSRTKPPFHRQIQSERVKIAIALASCLLASSSAASRQPSVNPLRVHSGRPLYYYQDEWPASDPVHIVQKAYRITVCCVCPC